MERILLLDLDNTLIHTSKLPSRVPGRSHPMILDGQRYYVHIRPYAIDLMQEAVQYGLTLGVWSAGYITYVDRIVRILKDVCELRGFTLDLRIVVSLDHDREIWVRHVDLENMKKSFAIPSRVVQSHILVPQTNPKKGFHIKSVPDLAKVHPYLRDKQCSVLLLDDRPHDLKHTLLVCPFYSNNSFDLELLFLKHVLFSNMTTLWRVRALDGSKDSLTSR